MESPVSTNQTNPDSASSQVRDNQSSISASSLEIQAFDTKSYEERADILSRTFIAEEIDVASGTIESKEPKVDSPILVNGSVRKSRFNKKPKRQSSEDYLQIIRAHYIKVILKSVKNVQPHAETPNATVHINKILHTICEFEENSPDDSILEVLFAFYDALAYQHQWTTYTTEQFEKAEGILHRIAKTSMKPKYIEKAIADLEDTGFDTIPYSFSLDEEAL